jgi:cell division protein FtsB
VASTVSPNYYNTLYQRFSNIRIAKFLKTHTEEQIRVYLQTHPELHIYTIIDNEPLLSAVDQQQVDVNITTRSKIAARQRVKDEDGDDYIDEFGRYVYITSRIGTEADKDLRYEDKADPELFTVQYIANELSHNRDRQHIT